MAGSRDPRISAKRQRPISSGSEKDDSREARRAARRRRNEERRIRREERIRAAVSEVQREASTESASSVEQWVSTVVVLKWLYNGFIVFKRYNNQRIGLLVITKLWFRNQRRVEEGP